MAFQRMAYRRARKQVRVRRLGFLESTPEREAQMRRLGMLTNAEGSRTSRYFGPALRQERFVAEYLIDLNKTAAYKRAGYRARGHAAEVNASRLSLRPAVQRLIRLRQLESLKRAGWNVTESE